MNQKTREIDQRTENMMENGEYHTNIKRTPFININSFDHQWKPHILLYYFLFSPCSSLFNITHLFSFSDQFSWSSLQEHVQAGAASCMQVRTGTTSLMAITQQINNMKWLWRLCFHCPPQILKYSINKSGSWHLYVHTGHDLLKGPNCF